MCGGGAVCGSLMKCCCMTLRLGTAGPFYTITTQPALLRVLWVCTPQDMVKIIVCKFDFNLNNTNTHHTYMYAFVCMHNVYRQI